MAYLNEQRFLVLAALASGPRHGYGLVEEISGLTNGEYTPRAGALYQALEKLSALGLVELDHEQVVDSRLRRYYRLTSEGTAMLRSEANNRQATAGEALFRLGKSQ